MLLKPREVLSTMIVMGACVTAHGAHAASAGTATTWAPDQITFVTSIEGDSLLTVTGPDFALRLRGRGLLAFQPVDAEGLPLPDGAYRYELREIVDRPAMRALRHESDRQRRQELLRQMRRRGEWPPRRPRIEHSIFEIRDGALVAPVPARNDAVSSESESAAAPALTEEGR